MKPLAKILGTIMEGGALCLTAFLGFQTSSMAQCLLSVPGGNTGNVTFLAFPPNSSAYFQDTVNVGNATVPPGIYPGWCVDVVDNIDINPTTGALDNGLTYNVLMYSTYSACETAATLGSQLKTLGYPAADYNATQADWNAVNYIINNPTLGGTIAPSYWDIQNALWAFVGGPSPFTTSQQSVNAGYPPFNQANVSALVTAAQANPGYTPPCGGVVAVVVAIPAGYDGDPTPLSQLTIIVVPMSWASVSGKVVLDCNTSGSQPPSTEYPANQRDGGAL